MPERTAALLFALLLSTSTPLIAADETAAAPAGSRLERFRAEVVALHRIGQQETVGGLRCDHDPRWLLELRHDDGELRRYAIHSPARTFMGQPRIGSRHRFVLLRYDDRERCYLFLQRTDQPDGGG